MGFFSLKAVCGVCGNECGLNRFRIKRSDSWLCPNCMRRAGGLNAMINNRLIVECTIEEIKAVIDGFANKEFRKKCNVCGKIYCYTGSDLQDNARLAKQATGAAGMAVLQSLAGTTIAASSELNRSDNLSAQIKDYTRCPFCNSKDISDLSEEEWKAEQAKAQNPAPVSAADELRKFKELLDSGVITQEEFDAKKKQLLGL